MSNILHDAIVTNCGDHNLWHKALGLLLGLETPLPQYVCHAAITALCTEIEFESLSFDQKRDMKNMDTVLWGPLFVLLLQDMTLDDDMQKTLKDFFEEHTINKDHDCEMAKEENSLLYIMFQGFHVQNLDTAAKEDIARCRPRGSGYVPNIIELATHFPFMLAKHESYEKFIIEPFLGKINRLRDALGTPTEAPEGWVPNANAIAAIEAFANVHQFLMYFFLLHPYTDAFFHEKTDIGEFYLDVRSEGKLAPRVAKVFDDKLLLTGRPLEDMWLSPYRTSAMGSWEKSMYMLPAGN